MSSRVQNAGLTALVVLSLVIVAFALRTPAAPVLDSGPATTGPASSSAQSPQASASATASPTPSASPSPSASIGQGSTVAFLGDSFAAGAGASAPDKRWTTLVSTKNGWAETNLAHAQTGYVQAGSLGTCTPKVCAPFTAVVPKAVAAKPRLVIITGGANDVNQGQSAVAAAVTQTVSELKAGLPDATIVVTNPWWDLRPTNPNLAGYTTTIRTAATNAGAIWAETGQPLATPALMKDDGVQPNDEGHAALAAAITAALERAGIVSQ